MESLDHAVAGVVCSPGASASAVRSRIKLNEIHLTELKIAWLSGHQVNKLYEIVNSLSLWP